MEMLGWWERLSAARAEKLLTGVLAAEALQVLGAWQHSLRMSRPTLTWAFEVAGGRVCAAVDRLAAARELLWEADAIVEASGQRGRPCRTGTGAAW